MKWMFYFWENTTWQSANFNLIPELAQVYDIRLVYVKTYMQIMYKKVFKRCIAMKT